MLAINHKARLNSSALIQRIKLRCSISVDHRKENWPICSVFDSHLRYLNANPAVY